MSQYRDHLDAARARIETLEAKLKERDAALAARDAELAEVRAEVERLRHGSTDDGPFDPPDPRNGHRALLLALAMCGFATAAGYALVRPSGHCVQRRASSAHVVVRAAPTPAAEASRMDEVRPMPRAKATTADRADADADAR